MSSTEAIEGLEDGDVGGSSAAPANAAAAPAGMRRTGRVVHFDARRGFGWVVDLATGKTLGAHHTEICPKWDRSARLMRKSCIYPGECVTFLVGADPLNGKPCCTSITGLCAGGPLHSCTLVMDHVLLRRIRSRGFRTPPAARWRAYISPPSKPQGFGLEEAGSGAAEGAGAGELVTRRLGRVTSYHARNGWGWIADDAGQSHFVHHSEVKPLFPCDRLGAHKHSDFNNCLFTGECVEFSLGTNADGRMCCKGVTGLMQGALLMDFGLYACVDYRNRDTKHDDTEHDDTEHDDTKHDDAGHSDAGHSDAESDDGEHDDAGRSDAEHGAEHGAEK